MSDKKVISKSVIVFSDGNEIHHTGTRKHAEWIAKGYAKRTSASYTIKPQRKGK